MDRTVQDSDYVDKGMRPLVPALLRVPLLIARAQIIDGLHRAGYADLQPGHLAVLQFPGPEGRTPTELARSALTNKQGMNYLLTQLESGGYITRSVNPENRRERIVHLTDRGRAAITQARKIIQGIERDWRDLIGVPRYERLVESLGELNVALANERR